MLKVSAVNIYSPLSWSLQSNMEDEFRIIRHLRKATEETGKEDAVGRIIRVTFRNPHLYIIPSALGTCGTCEYNTDITLLIMLNYLTKGKLGQRA